jgi:hypothetical protein
MAQTPQLLAEFAEQDEVARRGQLELRAVIVDGAGGPQGRGWFFLEGKVAVRLQDKPEAPVTRMQRLVGPEAIARQECTTSSRRCHRREGDRRKGERSTDAAMAA